MCDMRTGCSSYTENCMDGITAGMTPGCFKDKAVNHQAEQASVSTGLTCYVHKGWTIEYRPKPGRPGHIDWDATHPDEETGFNGKSPADLEGQIDSFLGA